ncbi:hypothetical protein [Leifsonia sp. EB34]|uniref:hypothetical protein n=1 Tax=Leifsonia sp. EB34 TaxID=3156303 RepID=UPI0035136072
MSGDSGLSATKAGGSDSAARIPRQVTVAFWLYLIVAALVLVGVVLAAITVEPATAHLPHNSRLAADVATSAFVLGVGFAATVGVVYAAAYVVSAVFLRRGANWARIVLLVVTAFSLFGVLGGYGVGAVRAVVGVVATVLIFVKPGSEYFRPRRVAGQRNGAGSIR